MGTTSLHQQIGRKDSNKEKIAQKVACNPEQVSEVVNGLGDEKARVKYGCAKILRILSEQEPQLLYPHLDFFIKMLDSDNQIMKWEAILLLGNLAVIDKAGKIDTILDKYLAPIPGPVMITAANITLGAAKIALAKPYLAPKIAKEIMKVECGEYQTAECRNIVLGHAIKSLDMFFELIKEKEPVISLVKMQLANTRNSTRKKAEKFLKKRKLF